MPTHTIASSPTSPAYPIVRRIGIKDLKLALAEGTNDFLARPSHLVFLGLIYPIIGIWLAVGTTPPLIFPLLSGFALIGPFAAIGLYEVSRARELGLDTSWKHAVAVVRSHAMFPILSLGLILLVIFACWLLTAQSLYTSIIGPRAPQSFARFISDILGSQQGWWLIGIGTAVGFVFAVVAFSVSVVSFPMLLDREVDVPIAILTSIKAVMASPLAMAAWGFIVAASLAAGFLLLFAGLAVVVPVLAHTTWHLYRKVVEPAR
ncbi:MAG TPA: DUF2189 domain-containing protein [Methylocella sp.]|nr:DUF2189 domain-containing protein [Methylocella sp.]